MAISIVGGEVVMAISVVGGRGGDGNRRGGKVVKAMSMVGGEVVMAMVGAERW